MDEVMKLLAKLNDKNGTTGHYIEIFADGSGAVQGRGLGFPEDWQATGDPIEAAVQVLRKLHEVK